ncbi:MAG: SDR family oxidoreductase [Saprospiraceae bacterium]|nr:SDR family oxidoreductase [Saprospiraceae bacterium]
MKDLEGTCAVVTGAAGQIGFATAKALLARGAHVMLVDRDQDGLGRCMDDLQSEKAHAHVADVTLEDQVAGYVAAAKSAMGRIDIFFNNAGIEGPVCPIVQFPMEAFDEVWAVNVRGVFLGMKHVMPVMGETGGGSIIITSSVAGLQGLPALSAYVTSKHAVIGIMRSAAKEGAALGIRVNCVNPGVIDSRMMRSIESGLMPDNPSAIQSQFEQMVPLQRYGTDEEVAKLVTFLASAESQYVTGATYVVDGGMWA